LKYKKNKYFVAWDGKRYRAYGFKKYFLGSENDCIWKGENYEEALKQAKKANQVKKTNWTKKRISKQLSLKI
jgi:hypothetical protein